MDTKIWYKSKRFWGTVASALGFLLMIFGAFFGKDYTSIVTTVGAVLNALGIPFTFYAAKDATVGIAWKK